MSGGALDDKRSPVKGGDPDRDERFSFVCCRPADVAVSSRLGQQPAFVVSSETTSQDFTEVLTRGLPHMGPPVVQEEPTVADGPARDAWLSLVPELKGRGLR